MMRQQAPPQQGGRQQHPNFMAKLERAEFRDEHQSGVDRGPKANAAAAAGITLDNWEQRSKQINALAIQNEVNELMAKERLGKLPQQQQAPQQSGQAPPQGRGQQQQMQMMQQQQMGMRGGPMPPQKMGGRGQPQQIVSMHGSYDPFDDRMPRQMQGGGQVMNSQMAQAQRRGQGSSIVFG